ncbi:ABC transporter ATP-binding protein [Pontibacter silvestris]|uniref:ABC transporter ATP-binding protein n=1 Tax=Pontibacter silvestris TaxID=2305183 RepID=A0ABW4WWY3_9BACT|nr:ATP-binding cassette domain-containing protein [Pontibacter silvestris]MCC9136933.1 ATP-binding cassette domain-containing protein [Pontibacter silvestris]
MIRINLEKQLHSSGGEMQLQVALQIKQGEFVTIYGESGAGKTSILRMLAGLLQPERGLVEVNGKKWLDTANGTNLKPQQRKLGYVFQDYALFPNMTVRENLLFALEKHQPKDSVNEVVELMELNDMQHRYPATLSGGQRQRVALGRALVQKPEFLLLDEPLSALDESMRARLQDYILKVHQTFNLTTILVSHDVSEILRMSERMFVLKEGKIVQVGAPDAIFSDDSISGKFRLVGTITKIQQNGVVYIISVLAGVNLIKVVATAEEAATMATGDKVMVVSKAFNPLIKKL